MKQIGFIGIGAMGKGMIKNLLKNGSQVYAYDANDAAMQSAAEMGAIPKASPTEVGMSASVIFTSLPGPTIVKEVITGENGLLGALSPGSYILDTSTIDPQTARELYKLGKERDITFFDCPVSGGPAGADQGTLTIMIGGEEDQLSTVIPYLEMIGRDMIHMGQPGAGQVAKLCHNAVVATITAVLGEALAVGVKAGVEPKKLAEVMNKGSAHNRVLSVFGPNILNGTYGDVKFSLSHMHKDLELFAATAKNIGAPALIGSTIYQLYEAAKTLGKGGLDSSAVCQVIELLANCQIAAKDPSA